MAHMNAETSNAVVVGGSLSGLFSALVLAQNGYNVTILERQSQATLQDQGAGLRVTEDVVEFLDEHGITVDDYTLGSLGVCILDNKGDETTRVQAPAFITNWSCIHRMVKEKLDQILAAGNATDYFHYDSGVNGVYEDDSGRLVVQYSSEGVAKKQLTDLVIATDGASSSLARSILKGPRRQYAGYIALRGTVDAADLSSGAQRQFRDYGQWHFGQDSMFITYNIPGTKVPTTQENALVNWVWYINHSTQELQGIMEDVDGICHRYSLPRGAMRQDILDRYRKRSVALPEPLAEAVAKTQRPFLQTITDSKVSDNVLLGGKLLVIGDAVAGIRPHAAIATSQAVFHASCLGRVLKGEMSKEQWRERTLEYSTKAYETGIALGKVTQGDHLSSREKLQAFSTLFLGLGAELSALRKKIQLDN